MQTAESYNIHAFIEFVESDPVQSWNAQWVRLSILNEHGKANKAYSLSNLFLLKQRNIENWSSLVITGSDILV